MGIVALAFGSVPAAWLVPLVYVLGVGSAVLPWLNAEVLLLGAVPLAGHMGGLLAGRLVAPGALVVAMTAGQMTGKCAIYWLARRGRSPQHPRLAGFLARWRDRIERRPYATTALVFVSAVVGFPPFFLVSIAAGAGRMAFAGFVTAGTIGRLIHFGAIAAVPTFGPRWW